MFSIIFNKLSLSIVFKHFNTKGSKFYKTICHPFPTSNKQADEDVANMQTIPINENIFIEFS